MPPLTNKSLQSFPWFEECDPGGGGAPQCGQVEMGGAFNGRGQIDRIMTENPKKRTQEKTSMGIEERQKICCLVI